MIQPCIGCSGRISIPFAWGKLITFSIFHQRPLLPIEHWFCEPCRQKFIQVDEGCSMCSRSLKELDPQYIRSWEESTICYDCERWKEWERSISLQDMVAKQGEAEVAKAKETEAAKAKEADAGNAKEIEAKETESPKAKEAEDPKGKDAEEVSVLLLNRSALIYNEWTQDLIERYKFRRDERLKYVLASFLFEKWTSSIQQDLAEKGIEIDIISVIPLSESRLRERGFNQSALIARLLSQELQIPYEESLLLRAFEEGKQSKKDRNQRLQEIFKKFINNPHTTVDITNRSILMIDDIYTTGATMYAAAYTLKYLGAKSVVSLTIAR